MTTIHLAHSLDSASAFMFYALIEGKIDTDGITYVYEQADIDSLNQRAQRGELEVAAVSIHACAYLTDTYALLPHGGSMGDRYGPRLVSRTRLRRDDVTGKRIATPGPLTSGFLALRLYQPDFVPVPTQAAQVGERVMTGDVDAGLLIQESQLTYEDDGLFLVEDMGEWWYQDTGLPLPLGGIVVRKDLGDDVARKVSAQVRESIAYGLNHRQAALDHAARYAGGLDREKADEFVGRYVNDFTLDYGPRGRAAVALLLDRGVKAGIITRDVRVAFVED